MDTYGFPKTGWSKPNGGVPRLERLAEHFPLLIDAAREALSRGKDDVCLIFNNVGNWPVDKVALAGQDAIYVEVWKPYERYSHLKEIISWASHLSCGKNVILAAYLKPFREPGPLGAAGAANAFRLLNSVTTAHGAYHLLHGEDGGVLTQGYYVDHSRAEAGARRIIRDYCDFGVRFGPLLYDRAIRDVSMTHADGDNTEYRFEGFGWSAYGESGKVWTVIRESEGVKLIHFVNLTGIGDDRWNEGKELPATVRERVVRIELDRDIEELLSASPDRDGGRAAALDYRVENTVRGRVARIELPPLSFWDILILKHASDV